LDAPACDRRLASFALLQRPSSSGVQEPLAADLADTLERIAASWRVHRDPHPFIVLDGADEHAQRCAAERLCARLGIPLLRVDLQAVRAAGATASQWLDELLFEQRLTGAALLLEGCESLRDAEGNVLPESLVCIGRLANVRAPVLLCGSSAKLRWPILLRGQRRIVLRFDYPIAAQRRELWRQCAARDGCTIEGAALDVLANRYVLTSGQISDAVATAADARRIAANGCELLDLEALTEAVRSQSRGALEDLATLVVAPHTWDDLVVPRTTERQLKDIAAAMRNSHIVYGEWGFARRVTCGRGVKALFSGAPGTGKTMAAGVIARDLNMDMFVINLSQVVSKYIGDTERNLDRIFRAARNANAILFFDEADALFGKRSEVKDAHDRYANIEVAYLLQKVEFHEGHVLLASNLKKNIDEAFSRRLHYIVEFSRPDAADRQRLWRGMFPAQTPLAGDIDFAFLAEQFDLTGGDIQNVALDAAFLAADNGRTLDMEVMISALSRHLIKKGKVPAPVDFKQYHSVLSKQPG
jgi:hypothetical protein